MPTARVEVRSRENKARRNIFRRVLGKRTVFDAAHDRMRDIFHEYGDNVVVSFSGGKDSTIILNIAVRVAEELGMLPVKAMFIDQETEWTETVDICRTMDSDPRIDFKWYQIPFGLSNSLASFKDGYYLKCWNPDEKHLWLRDKEPNSIHENTFGIDTFKELFSPIQKHLCNGADRVAVLTGMRCTESFSRNMSVSWNGMKPKPDSYGIEKQFIIYDWRTADVWKAIHDNGWAYSKLYDRMYQQGVTSQNMRCSSLIHSQSTVNLWHILEIDPELFEKICNRCPGVHQVAHSQRDEISSVPRHLPEAFTDWLDYRDYLIEHLVTDEETKEKFRKGFKYYDYKIMTMEASQKEIDGLTRQQISSVIKNEHWGQGGSSLEQRLSSIRMKVKKRGGRIDI